MADNLIGDIISDIANRKEGNYFEYGEEDSLTGQKTGIPSIKDLANNSDVLELIEGNRDFGKYIYRDKNFIFESDFSGQNAKLTDFNDVLVIDPNDGQYTRIYDFNPLYDSLIIRGASDNIHFQSDNNSTNRTLIYDNNTLIGEVFNGSSISDMQSSTYY